MESQDRMRGLRVLRDLERVALDEAVTSEVSVASLVIDIGADRDRSDGERVEAWCRALAPEL